MIGIVGISHSKKIAEGLLEMAEQMATEAPISVTGGTKDSRIGTDVNEILNSIDEVYSEDGVLVFYDLGSAMMNAEMALEFLDEDRKSKVKIIDAPLVEGLISASIYSNINMDMDFILSEMDKISINER